MVVKLNNKHELTERIKEKALRWADLVGIAPVERFSKAPKGHRPEDLVPGAKSVIVCGLRWVDSLIDGLPEIRPLYTRHMITMREMCDREIYRMCVDINMEGFKAFPIPNGDPFDIAENMGYLSLKHAAVAAGLGNFGLSNLVLSPEFGPRQRWGAIITDAELDPDPLCDRDICTEHQPECGYSCINNCPIQAIPENHEMTAKILKEGVAIDKIACTHYQDNYLGKFGRDGYTYRCGMCIKNCPAGRPKSPSDSLGRETKTKTTPYW